MMRPTLGMVVEFSRDFHGSGPGPRVGSGQNAQEIPQFESGRFGSLLRDPTQETWPDP